MAFNPQIRIVWIDLSKGVAIFLVVLGHCWIGLRAADIISNETLYRAVRDGIYLFHMPLFFMLSGLMTVKLVESPLSAVLTSRVALLLYPLVLWTYLMNLGKLAMGNLANVPVTLESFNWYPLPPQWQFWFLWALFLLHVSTKLIASAASSAGIRLGVFHWAALLGLSVLGALFIGDLGWVDPYLRSAILFAPFFFLGALLSQMEALPVISPVWPTITFVFCQIAVLGFAPPPVLMLLLAALAALSVVLLSRWLAEQPALHKAWAPLVALGVASMAIYLAHTFFSAPVRVILVKLDITSVGVHVFLGTMIGIIGPMALLWLSQKLGGRRALGF